MPPQSVKETDACPHRPRRQWAGVAYVYFEEEPGRRALRPFSNSSKREIAVGSAIPRRKACRCTVLPVDLSRSSEGIV